MATKRSRLRTHASLKGASKIMSIDRIRNVVPSFAYCLLICAVLICGPSPAFAQTAESSEEQAPEARSASAASQPPDQASEEQQQQPSPQSVICGVTHLGQCLKDIGQDQAGIWTSPLRIAP